MQANFTGRTRERCELTEWFTSGECPMFAYVAIGGMGKSALTWAWLQRDLLRLPLLGVAEEARAQPAASVPEVSQPEGVLWWSFYERESTFQKFLDQALTYVSGGRIDPRAIPSIRERMQALYHLLCQRRFLLVLDGVERILRAYARMDAAYRGDEFEKDERGDFRSCTDPNAGTFLRWLASGAMKSKALLTSRLFPRELNGLAGCRRVNLTAFDLGDAVIFFHAQGVKGTRGRDPSCLQTLRLPAAGAALALGPDRAGQADARRHPGGEAIPRAARAQGQGAAPHPGSGLQRAGREEARASEPHLCLPQPDDL